MLVGTRRSLFDRHRGYYQKIKGLFGSSVIAYWPLSEISGSIAYDMANGHDGVYSGDITLNDVDSPVIKGAPTFGGTNGKVNIYSAGLAAAFNSAEGTVVLYTKISPAVWASGVADYLFALRADVSNTVLISKSVAGNLFFGYVSGGVGDTPSAVGGATGWLQIGIAWSKSNDRVNCYVNGYNPYVEQTGLGVWAGALHASYTTIGTYSTFYFPGNISNALLLNREASASEMLRLSKLGNLKFTIISILGDSIPDGWHDWPYYFARGHNNGETTVINHAVAGQSISANMDAQVVASAGDDADIIIINLGRNDNNAGDMGVLQAEIEENLIELGLSNPGAVIYFMNVLPAWTDVGGLTPIDLSNIRTAIAAACTAQGVTCWDTYTAPWIVVGDTLDGTHLTLAGAEKVADAALAII